MEHIILTPELIARLSYDVATPFYQHAGLVVPAWDKFTEHHQAMINRVMQHLNGHNHEDAHQEWLQRLTQDHWRPGKDRSYVRKTHPHLKPFGQLSEQEKTGHAIVFMFATPFMDWYRDGHSIPVTALIALTEAAATQCAEHIDAAWHFGACFRQLFVQHALQSASELIAARRCSLVHAD